MAKLSIRNIETKGKEILMRVDFNVPLDEERITDDTRIQAALPSIRHLINGGAKLVLCSHLGRPKGEANPKYTLKPAALHLESLLGQKVHFAESCIGEATQTARQALKEGEILLLQNTRYEPGEEKNEPQLSKNLAGNAEIFVNDAFGTAHRAHASTEGVTHHIPQSAMGFLMERELEYLVDKLSTAQKPFIVVMGGAKVSDKIEVITALLEKADTFLIGGAMAYTFLKAQGYKIGQSLVENDKLDLAKDILTKAEQKNVKFLLPEDTRITHEFKEGAPTHVTAPYTQGGEIPDDAEGIDIGDLAIKTFSNEIKNAKTIVWNGPMGVFEIDAFAKGTEEIAKAVAASTALSIVGGGDSVTAINKFGLEEQVDFISTGGGASLELLEGKKLPGVESLTNV